MEVMAMWLWIITTDIRLRKETSFSFSVLFFLISSHCYFNHLQEDVELIGTLGFSAYRFSISWSRIFPGMLFISFPTLSLAYIHFKLEYRYSYTIILLFIRLLLRLGLLSSSSSFFLLFLRVFFISVFVLKSPYLRGGDFFYM